MSGASHPRVLVMRLNQDSQRQGCGFGPSLAFFCGAPGCHKPLPQKLTIPMDTKLPAALPSLKFMEARQQAPWGSQRHGQQRDCHVNGFRPQG